MRAVEEGCLRQQSLQQQLLGECHWGVQSPGAEEREEAWAAKEGEKNIEKSLPKQIDHMLKCARVITSVKLE